jgi:hypothetical protein
MNPVDWLRAIYGWLGADYPRASLCGAILLGAILGGAVWRFAAHVYVKGQPVSPPPPTIVNTTNGPQSPIILNNPGSVTITNEHPKTSQPPAKDKSK